MIADTIDNAGLYKSVHPGVTAAFEFINKAIEEDLPVGKYEIDGRAIWASVQEYETKTEPDGKWEAHRDYIDVQFVREGREVIYTKRVGALEESVPYNPEKDVVFYKNISDASAQVLESGEWALLFPEDAQRPGAWRSDSKW